MDGPAVQPRALGCGDELLLRAELVDVAEGHVRHRVAFGDGDADAVQRNGPPGVERAVDRVDDHPQRRLPTAEGDGAPLLGDGSELVSGVVEPLELVEDRVLAEAVDHQRLVSPLADALVLRARLDPLVLGEDALLDLDGPSAGGGPFLLARAGNACGLRRVAAASCLSHGHPRGRG